MESVSIESLNRHVPVHSVNTHWLASTGITVDMLRLDLLHPQISGNKWFKLKENLAEAKHRRINSVLSFGGAWSNHIHALAAAGYLLGITTIGVIRGERAKTLSDTLRDAEQWGMQLHFVSRRDYRRKQEQEFLRPLYDELQLDPKTVWLVPEGGSNALGARGCEDILASGSVSCGDYDEIWLACGTGATLAGIINSGTTSVVKGVPVLKGGGFLQHDIRGYLHEPCNNWALLTDHHCGGYGKTTAELMAFIESFQQETDISLDQVYTGKVLLALKKSILSGDIDSGCRILVIHTGGLQGKRGIRFVS